MFSFMAYFKSNEALEAFHNKRIESTLKNVIAPILDNWKNIPEKNMDLLPLNPDDIQDIEDEILLKIDNLYTCETTPVK